MQSSSGPGLPTWCRCGSVGRMSSTRRVRRNASAPPSGSCPDGRRWSGVSRRRALRPSTPPCGAVEGDTDPVESVDVRGLAVPATEVRRPAARTGPASDVTPPQPVSHQQHQSAHPQSPNPRAKVLARRRRTTTLLFVAFTAGAVVAAVGGIALLWAPALPRSCSPCTSRRCGGRNGAVSRCGSTSVTRRRPLGACGPARRPRARRPGGASSGARRSCPGSRRRTGALAAHRRPSRSRRADRPRGVGRPAARPADRRRRLGPRTGPVAHLRDRPGGPSHPWWHRPRRS